jgi:hypothetical protein
MKKLLIIVLVLASVWSLLGFIRGSKDEAAQLITLAPTEQSKVHNFIRKAFADYEQNGEKALKEYWAYPIYEPEFNNTIDLMGKLDELKGVAPGRAVHPKFNPKSLLIDAKVDGRNIQISLTIDEYGYAIESVKERD